VNRILAMMRGSQPRPIRSSASITPPQSGATLPSTSPHSSTSPHPSTDPHCSTTSRTTLQRQDSGAGSTYQPRTHRTSRKRAYTSQTTSYHIHLKPNPDLYLNLEFSVKSGSNLDPNFIRRLCIDRFHHSRLGTSLQPHLNLDTKSCTSFAWPLSP
jgi:hypothetical protein